LTLTELHQVFSNVYPKLEGRSMYKLFRQFSSIQNKNLIEYRKLLEYLKARISQGSPKNLLEKAQNVVCEQTKETEHVLPNAEETDKLVSKEAVFYKSPTTKRMQNIKNEILKQVMNSQEPENFNPVDTVPALQELEPELIERTKLEGLISPRMERKALPKLNSRNLQKSMNIHKNGMALSQNRERSSQLSTYSTFSTSFFSKTNQVLQQKLGYEWKNIMRSLNAVDLNSSGIVTKKEFENCVHKHGVYLSRDELSNICKRYSQDGDVNYHRISVELGLHKPSFDYMKPLSKYKLNVTKIKSIREGPNDLASQMGELVRAAKTERISNHEMTQDAIRFAVKEKKASLVKVLSSFDKNTGRVDKADFIKIMKTHGIYIAPQLIDKFTDEDGKVSYNEFIQVYE